MSSLTPTVAVELSSDVDHALAISVFGPVVIAAFLSLFLVTCCVFPAPALRVLMVGVFLARDLHGAAL